MYLLVLSPIPTSSPAQPYLKHSGIEFVEMTADGGRMKNDWFAESAAAAFIRILVLLFSHTRSRHRRRHLWVTDSRSGEPVVIIKTSLPLLPTVWWWLRLEREREIIIYRCLGRWCIMMCVGKILIMARKRNRINITRHVEYSLNYILYTVRKPELCYRVWITASAINFLRKKNRLLAGRRILIHN